MVLQRVLCYELAILTKWGNYKISLDFDNRTGKHFIHSEEQCWRFQCFVNFMAYWEGFFLLRVCMCFLFFVFLRGHDQNIEYIVYTHFFIQSYRSYHILIFNSDIRVFSELT